MEHLNLGSGRGLPGYINLDIAKTYGGKPQVIADGKFLPFRDKAFETVLIKDVLSVTGWRVVLAEAQRVSRKVLVVDHWWPLIFFVVDRRRWPEWNCLWGLKKKWYLGNIVAEIYCQ